MNMDDDFVSEVEKLRKAAKQNEYVVELLRIIDLSIYIDGYGNLTLTEEMDFLRNLEICKVAAAFVSHDLSSSAFSNCNKDAK